MFSFGSNNRMLIEKVIYASRKPKTELQILQILNLEIDTHIKLNPDLKYCGTQNLKPVENSDNSQTYTLKFELK